MPSSAEVKQKNRAIHLLHLWAFVACFRVKLPFLPSPEPTTLWTYSYPGTLGDLSLSSNNNTAIVHNFFASWKSWDGTSKAGRNNADSVTGQFHWRNSRYRRRPIICHSPVLLKELEYNLHDWQQTGGFEKKIFRSAFHLYIIYFPTNLLSLLVNCYYFISLFL
jgi:hypothetical protein